ncbi:PEP-utilizing enzyme [Conexibacter sp. SYSU D00693]|uniref:PEP-utilizing enzyme n=1 Tax=Conexibacter sp. SYSU D00693 TaxID=2812560 RepID=UPI00196B799D|nr:PEP-utilizing enzyme [Conexibacter sp. SYSU D00693]
MTGERPVAWSTINAGEALPGVVTPLTWSFFGDNVERAFRGAFCDLGVLRASEVRAPERREERMWDLFLGRAAANLDTFRWLGDLMPGTSADAIEQQIFGTVRPGLEDRSSRRRYPAVAAKAPLAVARVAARLRDASAEIRPWWERTTFDAPPASAAAARAVLAEAARRHEEVMRPHTLAAMLCQSLYEQVRALAERAGRPGLEIRLVTGYGDMAETDVVADMWALSRGRLELEAFLRRHGFHGPNEGELSARTWRLRPDPVEALAASYRDLPDEREPRAVEAGRALERRAAEQELLGALAPVRRPPARLVLALAGRLIPLRGVGKATFLQCSDVARTAARALGRELVADGVLDDPEDVFMLTLEELLAPVPAPGLREVAAERRAAHERHLELDLPESWEGEPEPRPRGDGRGAREEVVVSGIAVSPGVVEGRARLIVDPDGDEELEPGEVLVCRTTDPSWASVMVMASALVVDIGGPISHGAIVARELGIPCVTGTRTGTAAIRTGDLVRVDGSKGTVDVLEAVGAQPAPA